MKYEQLRDALCIHDGKVVVSPDRLTSNLAGLWTDCYFDQPVVITGAEPGPDDDQHETVVIHGKASFLNMPDLPVELRAVVDAAGDVQVGLRYTLLGAIPDVAAWEFSRSFPDLPQVVDWDKTYDDPATIPLDDLALFNAAYIVVSQPQAEPETGVMLQTGINFVSRLRPTGVVALIENLFNHPDPLVLYGTIRLPRPTDITVPLRPLQYPWDLADRPPGILLQADLGLGLGIGSMQFSDTQFRIYSPLTTAWQAENPTFQPLMAYAGQLTLPSAGVTLKMVAPMEPGANELLLVGSFEGVSLGKLADLADIAGTGDLLAQLPAEIQQAGSALGRLELTGAMLSLSLSAEQGFQVGLASFTVGIPDLKWHVWADHFVIDSLCCRFTVTDPFSMTPLDPYSIWQEQPKFEVMVTGTMEIEGVPVNIMASSLDKFTLYAELAGAQTISLTRLLDRYVPGTPAPCELTVDALRVSVAPFSEFSMAVAMARRPHAWVIDVGPTSLTVSDVVLAVTVPANGRAAGRIGGAISFGDSATLAVGYSFPGDVGTLGDITIRGFFPHISLSALIKSLANTPLALPAGFDLTFINSSVLIQKVGSRMAFRLGTSLADVGTVVFEVRNTGGQQWGFAAGIDLSSGCSKLPGLGPLKRFEEFFQLQKLLLVIASFEDATFTFPDMAQFNNPVIAGGRVALPGKSGIVQGLNLYANWVINPNDKQQKLLKQLFGLNTSVAITLQIGSDPSKEARLYAGFATKINGMPLAGRFGGQLSAGEIALFAEGAMTMKIQGQPQTFDVKLAFVTNGAFISATMKGNTPVNFGSFKIGNLALVIGVSWECVPSLGIAGTLAVGNFNSAVAVFFDATAPQKSMVAGAVSDLSLKDVLDTLVGNVAPSNVDDVLEQISISGTNKFEIDGSLAEALDQLDLGRVAAAFAKQGVTIPASLDQVFLSVGEPGSAWFLTDLKNKARHYQLKKLKTGKIQVSLEAQFYCAPQRTQIGALPPFDPSYYITGRLDIVGFHSESTIEMNPGRGIMVQGEMSKIVIGPPELFSLTAADGKGGPRLSIATFAQPNEAEAMFRSPHIYINGKLSLLGMSRALFVCLTKQGLEFDLNGELVPQVFMDLHGQIKGPTNLGVGGQVKIDLPTLDLGKLGKIDLDTGAEGQLDIGVDASKAYARLMLAFEFAGQQFSVPLDLDVKTAKLTDLADQVYRAVKRTLEGFLSDPDKWAKAVANGLISGVDDVEKVLRESFNKTADQAKQVAEGAFGTTKKEAEKLVNQAADETQKAAKKAKKVLKKLF